MRLIGVTIPDDKRVPIALTYIYGIGNTSAEKIAREAGIADAKRVKDLTPDEINKIQGAIERQVKVEGELRQVIKQNVQLLKELQTYRGVRHMRRLPAHGQRTKTNSRTIRGNVRKTAGSGKRKVELK
jgi:small subunit ribosomal protein S13